MDQEFPVYGILKFRELNFCVLLGIREKRENYAPRKFGRIRYCTLDLGTITSPFELLEWDKEQPKHTADVDALFFFVMVSVHTSCSRKNLNGNWLIILIAVFRVCVCLSVFLISEISGTGRGSTTLLSPTWKASPGKLHWLVLQLVRCMVWEKKPLELFTGNTWNHALHVTTVQYLINWPSFWEGLSFSPSTGTQHGRRMSSLCEKLC